MNRSLRLKRFDRMSRLLWAGLAIFLGVAAILSQLGSSETVASDPLNSQRFISPDPTVNYADVYWSLVDARVTEPDAAGVTTVIADVDVFNSNESTSASFFVDGLSLRSSKGLLESPEVLTASTRINLDRFANNESRTILRIESESTKQITLAFKTKRANFDLEDWVIEVRHKPAAEPAYLPLVGEPDSEVVSFNLSPQTQADSDGIELFSGRAASNLNFGGQRSLSGRSYFFAEISTSDPDATDYLGDAEAWSLDVDPDAYSMVSLTSEPRGEEVRYLAGFDVTGSMNGSNLVVQEPNGQKVEFLISEVDPS